MTQDPLGDQNPKKDSRIASDSHTENFTSSEIEEIAADLDLTKFQIRCLATLSKQDRHGLGIKDELNDYYSQEVNHGRLYPNLDKLVNRGLVDKSERDRRTNNYAISPKGQAVLECEIGWLEEQIDRGESA